MMSVKVYGADWCGDTKRTLRKLDGLGVAYDYVDVEQDEAASQWVKEQNSGKERKPTLDLGGRVLSVPSDAELEQALRAEGLLSGG
ncbi:MAG TPA: glutaredoxin family protein [Pyrinomonadaceae bacterium]|jgi:glutaredoxin|nr:glutaredoxin family protein [Pyrinomonadaceae bacterium]